MHELILNAMSVGVEGTQNTVDLKIRPGKAGFVLYRRRNANPLLEVKK